MPRSNAVQQTADLQTASAEACPFISLHDVCFAPIVQKKQVRKKVRKKRMSKSTARSRRYNAFISKAKSMGPRGQWREVLRLLDGLSHDGIPLNSYTYNSAMSSIAKSGR